MILDFLGANVIGMVLGHYTIEWLQCREYNWESSSVSSPKKRRIGAANADTSTSVSVVSKKLKRLLLQFTPYSWSRYRWPKNTSKWLMSSLGWVTALVLELNTFFIMHAFIIKPSHWTITARLILVGLQGAQAIPEWYEYTTGHVERIGPNVWLLMLTAVIELMIGMKYGRAGQSYYERQGLPPMDVLAIIAVWLLFTSVWIFIYSKKFIKQNKHKVDDPDFSDNETIPVWMQCLRYVSNVPLLFLISNWKY